MDSMVANCPSRGADQTNGVGARLVHLNQADDAIVLEGLRPTGAKKSCSVNMIMYTVF